MGGRRRSNSWTTAARIAPTLPRPLLRARSGSAKRRATGAWGGDLCGSGREAAASVSLSHLRSSGIVTYIALGLALRPIGRRPESNQTGIAACIAREDNTFGREVQKAIQERLLPRPKNHFPHPSLQLHSPEITVRVRRGMGDGGSDGTEPFDDSISSQQSINYNGSD